MSSKDEKGTSPLHLASEGGHLEIVNLLVEKGVKVNGIISYYSVALYLNLVIQNILS